MIVHNYVYHKIGLFFFFFLLVGYVFFLRLKFFWFMMSIFVADAAFWQASMAYC